MANNNATTDIKVKIPKHREFTALHEAVMDEQALTTTLQRIKSGQSKVDVSGANERNETPLHYAVYHKKLYAIEPLVAAGAKVNKRTVGGDTPLSLGVQSNGVQAVKKLIDVCTASNVRLDLNKGNLYGETPLHWACSYGRLNLVKLLVEAGASVDVRTVTGETPLFLAQQNKQKECADYLISKGATAPEPYKAKDVAIVVPPHIVDGFLKNEWEHEMRFGGALWGEKIEFFYQGKKLRPGFAVQINTVFDTPQQGKPGTTFRGYIRSVADDKQSFEATVKLIADHETIFPELNKEWNARIEWHPFKQNPWILVSLTPIDAKADPAKSYEKVFEAAKQAEQTYGRSITKEPQGSFAQMQQSKHPQSHSHDHGEHSHDHGHSHGHGEECNDEHDDHGGHGHSHGHNDEECDHDHEHEEECDHDHDEHGGHSHSHDHGGHGHSHGHGGHREMPEEAHWLLRSDVKPGMDTTGVKVITAFHIDSLGEVEYTFADGNKQSVRDPQKVPFLIQMMIMRSEQAASEGKEKVPLTFSSEFKQFALTMNMLSEDDLNEIGSVRSNSNAGGSSTDKKNK